MRNHYIVIHLSSLNEISAIDIYMISRPVVISIVHSDCNNLMEPHSFWV